MQFPLVNGQAKSIKMLQIPETCKLLTTKLLRELTLKTMTLSLVRVY